jgi:FkbM family methyltransferase
MAGWLIPMTRAYIRTVPFGREWFWLNVVGPYLTWRGVERVAKTHFGARLFCNTRDLIQCYIYYFGRWEPNLTQFISQRLKPGDVFVDVGANVGYFSLLASSLVGPTGSVIAIEASPQTYDQLAANIALNGADNVEAINTAVSDRAGLAPLFAGHVENCGETTLSSEFAAMNQLQKSGEVHTKPLSSLLSPDIVHRVKLIKIDVEGLELAVVRGMLGILEYTRADLEILIEVTPDKILGGGKGGDAVVDELQRYGFGAYVIENDYSGRSYMANRPDTRPRRLRSALVKQTDLVFSRLSAEAL